MVNVVMNLLTLSCDRLPKSVKYPTEVGIEPYMELPRSNTRALRILAGATYKADRGLYNNLDTYLMRSSFRSILELFPTHTYPTPRGM